MRPLTLTWLHTCLAYSPDAALVAVQTQVARSRPQGAWVGVSCRPRPSCQVAMENQGFEVSPGTSTAPQRVLTALLWLLGVCLDVLPVRVSRTVNTHSWAPQ